MTREEAINLVKPVLPFLNTDEKIREGFETLIPELKESKDERIRKSLIKFLTEIKEISESGRTTWAVRKEDAEMCKSFLDYLEKQKEASKAIEAVDRIDKYIDEHLANAHDMKDSNPDKKYYRGWDDALGKMAGILQDVYSGKNQKEQKPITCIDFDNEFENQVSHLLVSVLNGEHEYNEGFVKYAAQSLLGFAKKEQKPILEVFGFKVGDAVRLKDGDGRKHIIKSFEEVKGIHGPNFYHVEFEDDSARDGIYPGEEYPNGYYTQMEKFEEEEKPVEPSDEELQRHQDELYDFQVFMAKQAREHNITFSFDHDFEWHNFCAELLSYFNEKQKSAKWSEDDETLYNNVLDGLKYAYEDLTNNNSYDTADCIRRAFEWMKYRKYRFKKN